MKFIDKQKHWTDDEVDYSNDVMLHMDALVPCKQCQALTFFASRLYNVRLCSTECYDAYAQE